MEEPKRKREVNESRKINKIGQWEFRIPDVKSKTVNLNGSGSPQTTNTGWCPDQLK
jgi:hypothetical protein